MSNNRIQTAVVYLLLVSIIGTIGCSGSLPGDGTGGRYIYNYTMTEPVVNDQLLFKDAYITIQFKFDESAIKFQLQNTSELPVSIIWENVSVGLNNRVFPVRNTSTLYDTEQRHPLPVVIPSLGYVRDLVIPWEYVSLEKGKWTEKDLFPTNDLGSAARKKLILKYTGSQIKLFLPVKIGEVVQEYSFNFKVKGISSLPANRVPPVKERPTPPPVASIGSSNALMPVLIAGGILGLAIFVFSKDKTSPLAF